jgi:PBP1b-binding outer membrane lipoprotein LpoB
MKKISQIISVATTVLLLGGCTNNEMLNNSSNLNGKASSTKNIDEKKEYYPDGRLSNIIKIQDGVEK